MPYGNVSPTGVAIAVLAPSLVETTQNKDNLDTDLACARLCGREVLWILFLVLFIFGVPGQSQVTTTEELDALG